jgi:hypothetical protein
VLTRSRGARCAIPESSVIFNPLKNRGRRESRVPVAPMSPVRRKHGGRTTGETGNTPAFPARWFTAYFVLPPVTGLFCHRHAVDDPQSSAPASGRQDTRLRRPLASALVSCTAAYTASYRNVRDDREPAPSGTMAGQIGVRSNSSARQPASDPRPQTAEPPSNKYDVAVHGTHSIVAKRLECCSDQLNPPRKAVVHAQAAFRESDRSGSNTERAPASKIPLHATIAHKRMPGYVAC